MLIAQPIRAVPNDLDRCWMSDDYFDLIVWYSECGRIDGFQLCYDKRGNERALTWRTTAGFRHSAVDSGESEPLANHTPILKTGGDFPAQRVRAEFQQRSKLIHPDVRALVLARIAQFGGLIHDYD